MRPWKLSSRQVGQQSCRLQVCIQDSITSFLSFQRRGSTTVTIPHLETIRYHTALTVQQQATHPSLGRTPTTMEAIKSTIGLGKKESGEEPVSGETGTGTVAEPYDAGNSDEAQGETQPYLLASDRQELRDASPSRLQPESICSESCAGYSRDTSVQLTRDTTVTACRD
jgi:hypothetical protein